MTASANTMRRSRRATSSVSKRAVDRVDFERLGAVDALAGELADELPRILVRVDHHPGRGLARLVQPGGVRSADVDPGTQGAGEVAHRQRRLVRLRQPAREGDALAVLQAVRQHPGQEIFLGLRRLSGDAQRQRLVDAAVDVGELDVEGVHVAVSAMRIPREPHYHGE